MGLLLPHLPSPAFSFTDAHSLCYNFTVDPQPGPGDPWCVVQGQVDGNGFLSYECGGARIQSTSPLGEEVKIMNTWKSQMETLGDIGDFLQGQLPDVIPEKHMARGPRTLQGRMTGSWQFGFNGQMCLLFDSENGHWTEVHSGGRRMKEKWENDRAVSNFFKKVCMGDRQAWLRDFLVCWEEIELPGRTMTRGSSLTLLPLLPPDVSPHSTGLWTVEHGFLLIPIL
uniref:MHC class I-like antigen recognition-like domain-containing protein n=1 Tax=Moschus moschiferus TaxID=68415 RepID=A0A8C6D1N0_MOSMO